MYDVVVVGARCAGASVATLLARRGHRVALVDRAAFPSDTISSHFLWAQGAARLASWGLLERLKSRGCDPIPSLTFDFGSVVLTGRVPEVLGVSDCFCPRRTVLDTLLVDAAVEAGAGFTETKKYAKLGPMVGYQEAMLRICDAVEYAANAQMVPTVGYGGEIDPQLQASANIREKLEAEHVEPPQILFLVGPGTAHKWEPGSLAQSNKFIDAVLSKPRKEPDHIHFVTYTTAYHQCYWISIESVEKQYSRAEVDADRWGDEIRVTTRNISRIAIAGGKHVVIDGQSVDLANFGLLMKTPEGWRRAGKAGRYKKPGLQGPVDDAFKDAFLVVRPTGKPEHKEAGQYVTDTMEQFRKEWAKYMRGEVRIKDDRSVTDDDIDRYHLVLFGDLQSNKLTKRLAPLLMRSWPAAPLVPVLIAPNPLNPSRYVVFNSGHTFHEEEFKGTNALLYPRLGDYAVIHPTLRQVVRGGLFDTEWRQLLRPMNVKP